MAFSKSLVIQSGITKQIPDADELIVGAGIEAAVVGPLRVGNGGIANAFTITPVINVDGGVDTTVAAAVVFGGSGNASSWQFSDAPITTDNGIDRVTAGSLAIGAATATGVTVTPLLTASAGVDTASVDDTSGGGTLSLGTSAASAVDIGKVGILTTVKGNFQVDGTETITGTSTFNDNATFNGNVIFGNAVTDTVSFAFSRIIGNVPFQQGSNHTLIVDQTTAAGGVGGNLNHLAAVGGDSAVGVAGAGGSSTVQGGDGGAGTGFAGGAGGAVNLTGGTGGTGTVQGVGGDVNIQAGAGVTSGNIDIGTTAAASIDIGNAVDNPPTTFLGSGTVTANGLLVAGQSLRVTASGSAAYAEFDDGVSAAVSAATEGRLRYNDTTGTFQVSTQGGAYADLAVGGAESLAATLAVGNTTGGNNIDFTSGDNIRSLADGALFSISFSGASTGIGGNFSATAQAGAASSAGGVSTIAGGDGGANGAGGESKILGGQGGATSTGSAAGTGGPATVASGDGGAGSATGVGAKGGLVTIAAGDGGAGNGAGAGAGGNVSITTGDAGTATGGGNPGGSLTIAVGASTGASAGAPMTITGGTGAGSGTGGNISVTGGASSGAGQAGVINITGGACSSTGLGGHVNINAGNSTSGTDGDINIGTSNTDQITIGNATNNTTVIYNGTGIITVNGANRQIQLVGGGAGSGAVLRFTEGADPTAVTNTGFVYTKDVSAVTQLFYRASDGTVTQLTPSAGAETLAATLALGNTTGGNNIDFSSGDNIRALGDGVAFGISYSAAATGGLGGSISVTAQDGAATFFGGTSNNVGGVGGAASGATPGGNGGAARNIGGVGGAAAAGAGAAGKGGAATNLAGVGGAGSATGVAGAGGDAFLVAAAAGADGGAGGANGGDVAIEAGAATGAGTDGIVYVGGDVVGGKTSLVVLGNSTQNPPVRVAGTGNLEIDTGSDILSLADGTAFSVGYSGAATGAGGIFAAAGQDGGSTANGGAGNITGGDGGAASGATPAGSGGSGRANGGVGGAAGAGAGAAGLGGSATLLPGNGGAGSATGVAGGGGSSFVLAGTAGADGGAGGANGGNVYVEAGIPTGAGTAGTVNIGTDFSAVGETSAILFGNVTSNPPSTFQGTGLVTMPSARLTNGTAAYEEFDDGLTAAVSAAGEGRLRYNDTTKTFQVSLDGAAYTDLATGGAESLAATLAVGNTTGGNDIQFTGNDNIVALGDGVPFSISFSGAASAGSGGGVDISAQDASSGATGGGINATAGAGNGAGAGGAASVVGGSGGTTGAGGAATLGGGAATGTDGVGGQANVLGGAAAGEDAGGAVVVTGGAAPGSAAGGGINIDGGTSSTGDGGAVDIDGGVGGNADGAIRIGTNANGGVTVSYAGGGGISLADGTTIGSATNQTVTMTARVRLSAGVSIAFQNTVDHLLRPDQSTGGAVGRAIDVTGGRAATGGGLAGGAGRINGGSGDGAGAGGAAEVTGGGGGATGEGGIAKIQGGNGGFTSGDGGAARVVGGNAPTSGTGGGVLINAGTGSVAKGSIFIGDTNAAAIQLGNATDNTPVTIAGSGGLQMTTDGFVKMDESAAAPSTAANEGAIYTKDVSGATQLFYREDSNGTEHQITPGTGAAAGKLVISVDTTTNTMLTGQAGYFDANARVAQTDASAIGTSRLAGFYQGVSGQIQIAGVVDVTGRITGGTPAAGAPVYLDTATPGNVTGTAPSAGGDVVAEVGIMLSAAAFTMLIQPKSVIQL